jgi:DNA-binding CsgD family transcriptional regulator
MKPITPTEFKVLQLIAEGLSSADVASFLDMNKYTVLSHRRSLLKKFGVNNSMQLVRKALKEKVLSLNNRD